MQPSLLPVLPVAPLLPDAVPRWWDWQYVLTGKTVLMVTHRLRGLARFNQIIVMDNGQIIEQGSHAELLAKQGRYFQFKQRL